MPHHVVLRGNNRRTIFSHANDCARFLALVARALERSGCRLHALAVLANHAHLLVTPPEAPALAAFVKSFAQRYAQIRNRQRDGSGKLFQERYWSEPVLDDAYCAVVTAYIELNPVRAGLVARPEDYIFSTYAIHAGDPSRSALPESVWTPTPWYLGLAASPEARARIYAAWVKVVRDRDFRPDVRGGAVAQPAAALRDIEAQFDEPYAMRLERPDRTSAAEAVPPYGEKSIADRSKSRLITDG